LLCCEEPYRCRLGFANAPPEYATTRLPLQFLAVEDPLDRLACISLNLGPHKGCSRCTTVHRCLRFRLESFGSSERVACTTASSSCRVFLTQPVALFMRHRFVVSAYRQRGETARMRKSRAVQ